MGVLASPYSRYRLTSIYMAKTRALIRWYRWACSLTQGDTTAVDSLSLNADQCSWVAAREKSTRSRASVP
jgi:hypothetical protein